jgi:hypothetical protein
MLINHQLVPAIPLVGFPQQMNFQFLEDTLFLDSGQTQRLAHALIKIVQREIASNLTKAVFLNPPYLHSEVVGACGGGITVSFSIDGPCTPNWWSELFLRRTTMRRATA